MSDNLDQFLGAVRDAVKNTTVVYERVNRALILRLYQVLVESSPVKTGRYRAEHVILADRRFVFEHPGRVGPTGKPIPSEIIPPPDMGSVASSLLEIRIGEKVEFLNQIVYAEPVERANMVYAKLAIAAQHETNQAAATVQL